jgi:hypothetical protein
MEQPNGSSVHDHANGATWTGSSKSSRPSQMKYMVRLCLSGATIWTNVPEPVRLEIVSSAASRA